MYVDGFVLMVPKKKTGAYTKMARFGAKMWKKHGALQYMECVADDLKVHPGCLSFPKLVKPRKGETIWYSFIVYKSKKHRDAVNKKVMNDPAMKGDMTNMPFDPKRMAYGGFEVKVRF